MKKPKKPKLTRIPKPRVPAAVKQRLKRGKAPEEKVSEALQNVPRITNETVAEHREDVLSSARKYIYPLQHSKHRIVRISAALFIVVVIGFFIASAVDLYSAQGTSGFIYGVTRVVPFPVAKAGSSWVSYESYLFELRRNMHYYHTQQQTDFSTKDGQDQLAALKKQAMNQVIQDAYVKQLASKNHVSVSSQAVDNEVALLRNQNRLGSNDRVFKNVLNQFWGWSESDFKRELRQQLLTQAVVAKLDTNTDTRASSALQQLQSGVDFATLAKQLSDDVVTKPNGGTYAAPISQNDGNVAPQITAALFQLKPGQISTIINTGFTLEILKVISTPSPGSVQAAHIQFTFKQITDYTKPLQAKHPVHHYIKLPS